METNYERVRAGDILQGFQEKDVTCDLGGVTAGGAQGGVLGFVVRFGDRWDCLCFVCCISQLYID